MTTTLDLTSWPPRVLLDGVFGSRRDVPAAVPGVRWADARRPRDVRPGDARGRVFDAWVQLQATPRPVFDAAVRGARSTGDVLPDALEDMLDRLAPEPTQAADGTAGPWTGPSVLLDDDGLLRLCWAVACFTDVYRAGWRPGGPLDALPDRGPVDLLALAGDDAIGELRDLTGLARDRLLPITAALALEGPTRLAPTFAGSPLMPADADLVVGGALVELKTGQGPKAAGAGRRACLDATTLCQLLGYVLHDLDDRYRLRRVVLYQARYGHVASWELQALLDELAGRPVDLPAVRDRWRSTLLAGPPT